MYLIPLCISQQDADVSVNRDILTVKDGCHNHPLQSKCKIILRIEYHSESNAARTHFQALVTASLRIVIRIFQPRIQKSKNTPAWA